MARRSALKTGLVPKALWRSAVIEYMQEHKLTNAAMARRISVPLRTLQGWLYYDTSPSNQAIQYACTHLGSEFTRKFDGYQVDFRLDTLSSVVSMSDMGRLSERLLRDNKVEHARHHLSHTAVKLANILNARFRKDLAHCEVLTDCFQPNAVVFIFLSLKQVTDGGRFAFQLDLLPQTRRIRFMLHYEHRNTVSYDLVRRFRIVEGIISDAVLEECCNIMRSFLISVQDRQKGVQETAESSFAKTSMDNCHVLSPSA